MSKNKKIFLIGSIITFMVILLVFVIVLLTRPNTPPDNFIPGSSITPSTSPSTSLPTETVKPNQLSDKLFISNFSQAKELKFDFFTSNNHPDKTRLYKDWIFVLSNGLYIYNLQGKLQYILNPQKSFCTLSLQSFEIYNDSIFISCATDKKEDVFDSGHLYTANAIKQFNLATGELLSSYDMDNGLPSTANLNFELNGTDLWIGTFKGLAKLDIKTNKITKVATGITQKRNTNVDVLNLNNQIWFWTRANDNTPGGLSKLENGKVVSWNVSDFPNTSTRIDLGFYYVNNNYLVSYSDKNNKNVIAKYSNGKWVIDRTFADYNKFETYQNSTLRPSTLSNINIKEIVIANEERSEYAYIMSSKEIKLQEYPLSKYFVGFAFAPSGKNYLISGTDIFEISPTELTLKSIYKFNKPQVYFNSILSIDSDYSTVNQALFEGDKFYIAATNECLDECPAESQSFVKLIEFNTKTNTSKTYNTPKGTDISYPITLSKSGNKVTIKGSSNKVVVVVD